MTGADKYSYIYIRKSIIKQHIFVMEMPTWAVWVKIVVDTNVRHLWSLVSRLLISTGTCLQQVSFKA
jgi:hypothetical protein